MPMYYYSDGSQTPVGPLSLQQLHQLRQTGTLQGNTPVIEEGQSSWRTYDDFSGMAAPAPKPPMPPMASQIALPGWKTFLNFDRMLAPSLIKLVYFLGIGLIGLGLLFFLSTAIALLRYSPATGIGMLLLDVLGSAVALIIWRVLCELYILFFNIHDRVGEIRDKVRALSN